MLARSSYHHRRNRPLALVGGDRAVREPIRTGFALALEAFGGAEAAIAAFPELSVLSEDELHVYATVAMRGVNSPKVSSMGRLFDGVAALAGVCGRAEYEAQGPIESENLVSKARLNGERIGAGLRALADDQPAIGDVRGRGLMWGAEVVDPDRPVDALGSRPPDGARARAIKRRCLEHGLLIESGGRHGAVLRLLPPLVITDREITEMIAKLEKAFVDCA